MEAPSAETPREDEVKRLRGERHRNRQRERERQRERRGGRMLSVSVFLFTSDQNS